MSLKVLLYKPGHMDFLVPKEIFDGSVDEDRINTIASRSDIAGVYSITIGGEMAAVVGMVECWAGVGELFSVTSEIIKRAPVAFHKTCLRLIDMDAERLKFRRLQLHVKEQFEEGNKWALSLGFQREGLLREYDMVGTNCVFYGRLL